MKFSTLLIIITINLFGFVSVNCCPKIVKEGNKFSDFVNITPFVQKSNFASIIPTDNDNQKKIKKQHHFQKKYFPTKKSSITKIDSLEKKLMTASENDKIKILNTLSKILQKTVPKQSLVYSQQAMKLSKKNNDRIGEITALNNSGSTYLHLRDEKRALEYYFKALKISKTFDYKTLIAKSLSRIGVAYKKMGNYYSALEYYNRSLEIREKLGGKKAIASSFNKIGNIYRRLGNYDKALEYYIKAIKLGKKTNDKYRIAASLNNIGLVFFGTKQFEKALKYFSKSLKIKKTIGYKKGIAITLDNLGNLYEKHKKYKKALEYYFNALHIKKKLGDEYGTGPVLDNIGFVYMNLKNYDSALKYYLLSLKIRQKFDDKYGKTLVFNNLADLYVVLHNYSSASRYLEKSIKLSKEINSNRLLKDSYKSFSKFYLAKKNYRKSLEYFKLYSEIKDSIYTEKRNLTLADMEIKYDTEKKEKENEILRKNSKIQELEISHQVYLKYLFMTIAILVIVLIALIYSRYRLKHKDNKLLTKKNRLIKRQRMELLESLNEMQKLNATKDKFFSIISHDLKNPFTSLLGYSDLLITDYDKFSEDEKIFFIKEMNKSLKHTFSLLENLLFWSMAQRNEIEISPEKLDLFSITDNVIQLVSGNANKKNIKLKSGVSKNTFIYADFNSISTVLRNLLSNAVKFTGMGGDVSITSEEKDGFCKITISDSGVGISEEDKNNLFKIDVHRTTVGTSKEKGTGLGLILCKEFVEKNGGQIFVESKINQGSNFIFTIPRFMD